MVASSSSSSRARAPRKERRPARRVGALAFEMNFRTRSKLYGERFVRCVDATATAADNNDNDYNRLQQRLTVRAIGAAMRSGALFALFGVVAVAADWKPSQQLQATLNGEESDHNQNGHSLEPPSKRATRPLRSPSPLCSAAAAAADKRGRRAARGRRRL